MGTREDVPCEQSPFDLHRIDGKVEETFARRIENIYTLFLYSGVKAVYTFAVRKEMLYGAVFLWVHISNYVIF